MIIMSFLSWWYGPGWRQRVIFMRESLASLADYFSIDLLLRTFFSPFRQISAAQVQGPLPVQLRAFGDRLFSRVIGSVVRSMMIIVGCVGLCVSALLHAVFIACWPVIPLMPIIGVILSSVGWVPWSK